MPPPRMTSRLGTSVCASRPVESTQRGESIPSIGGRSGNEPVATIAELEGDVLPALDRDRVRVLEAAGALHPLDAVRLEEARRRRSVICLTTPSFHSFAVAEVELRLADVDAELGEGLLGLLERERGLHPRLRRDAARRAGRCRRAPAPSRCRRSSRRAVRRGSRPCSRPGLRRGRRRRHSMSSILLGASFSSASIVQRAAASRRPCGSRSARRGGSAGLSRLDAEAEIASKPSRSRALEQRRRAARRRSRVPRRHGTTAIVSSGVCSSTKP